MSAFNYWFIRYETRKLGSIGDWQFTSIKAIKADDLETALRYAREDCGAYGLETRNPLITLRGDKESIEGLPCYCDLSDTRTQEEKDYDMERLGGPK